MAFHLQKAVVPNPWGTRIADFGCDTGECPRVGQLCKETREVVSSVPSTQCRGMIAFPELMSQVCSSVFKRMLIEYHAVAESS